MQRTILLSIIRFLFKVLSRVEVIGLKNIPGEGGVIIAINHLSRVDAPLVYSMLERQDATGLVADKYKKRPFFYLLVSAVQGIWINRGEADLQALRAAQEHLQQGGILGIAPEGTRSDTGALIHAKTGVAYLAEKARVPIVPGAIWGTEVFVHEIFRLRRSRVTVRFGEAFTLLPLERGDRSRGLKRNTDELMCQIAALLPPQYHGVYADHPRLQELLDSLPTSGIIAKIDTDLRGEK